MALDSRQKRAAVIGVARPWYRNPDPNSMNAAQRASVANAYPVTTFASPGGIIVGAGLLNSLKLARVRRIG